MIPNSIDADGAFSSISSDDNVSKFDNSEYFKKSHFNYSSADSDYYKESRGRIKNLPSPLNIQKVLCFNIM